MAELLLHGLATASVDSTTGDIFKSASSVAVGVKTDLEGYLFRRTEALIRESVDGPDDHSDQLLRASTRPVEFLSDLVDEFVASKRNLLSHVSGFLSSESRLNKIKDFSQKVEMENIWALDERKATAETILESMDLKCIYHCPERFSEQDKLVEHRSRCKFRVVNCKNDRCLASFSAIHVEEHDSICPFKGAFVNDMNQRLQLLEKAQSLNELSGALDVRSLTLVIKEQEAKIKKLEGDIKTQEAKMKKLENENVMLFLTTTCCGSVTKVSGKNHVKKVSGKFSPFQICIPLLAKPNILLSYRGKYNDGFIGSKT
ncbi:hypothetical protein QOZ80_2AG0136810 [Eleusine coracana subsp. coracana]|nr:hypothetical protein QOZ80_2AG0136810 [Eleusine coracana subsp. coracana]